MKKLNYIALASLAAAITVVSCSKEEMQSSSVSEGTVLTASIAQSADTKTAMSGATENTNVSIVWTAGDKLSVLSGASYATNSEFTLKPGDAGKTSGSFAGAEISGEVIAVYPYASDVAYSTNKVTLNIPQTQAYTDATFAQNSVPMVAKGTVGTNLSFNYLFSAIAFKVKGSGKSVTKVTVAATTPLWGPAEISGLDGTPAITMTGTDSKYRTVELTCATAQDITSDKVFYIAVPAGTYTFAVNVYCSDKTVFHQSYTTAKTFAIGKIKYNSTAKSFSDNGPAYVEGSYIGEGQKINGIYWAPVNCGYDAAHTFGSLYQWGRKYGQPYETGTITPETLTKEQGEDPAKSGNFGKCDEDTYNWFSGDVDNTLWTENSKGTYDPCPEGWRVPTNDEMTALKTKRSSWTTNTVGGVSQSGFWFSGSTDYSESVPRVFLSAAGCRVCGNGNACDRGVYGYYWGSSVNGNSAKYLGFYDGDVSTGNNKRAHGFSVRCVQE